MIFLRLKESGRSWGALFLFTNCISEGSQMNADDLQSLYKLVRGNKAATVVLDAHAAYLDKRNSVAHTKLIEAREHVGE